MIHYALYFHRSALSKCHKFAENLDFAFSRCNFALVSLLKHAPFWRTTIPKAFRYHTEGTQNAWLRESLPPFALRSVLDRSPFVLRSSSVDPPFELRSSSVRAPFKLRSSSVQAPFELRSFLDCSPFVLRSAIEDRSKNDRRNIGESSEARRRCIETLMGNQGEGNPNKKTPQSPINPMLPISRKKL